MSRHLPSSVLTLDRPARSAQQLAAPSVDRPAGQPTDRRAVVGRRLLALAVLLAVGLVALGWSGADARLADPVADTVVVAPGDTLWEIAVATAPAGIDPRAHLRELMALNGFTDSDVAPWTVVLVPAW